MSRLSALLLPFIALAALAKEPAGEWRYWGGDAGSNRYAPLDQINADNIDEVGIVWRWQALRAPGVDGALANYHKPTPIYANGTLYSPSGLYSVVALDPATGATRWVFSPDGPPQGTEGYGVEETKDTFLGFLGARHSPRAVSYWADGKGKERILHNSIDGRLISIDAKTGKLDRKFGDGGYVDLRENFAPGWKIKRISSSSPGIVVGNVIVIQTTPNAHIPSVEHPPGRVRGYDVRTGELLWTFHTTPQEGEFGVETWERGSWANTGGGSVWSVMSADLEKGYVYISTESPYLDYYGGNRVGDNLFANSIVCLDARTGKRVWHFQISHHEIWDYDLPAPPILMDIVVDGRKIPAVAQLSKQAMAFVFNRYTGEPVWEIEEREVPASTVPGEVASPTQPFPTKPAPYADHGYNEDKLIDFTPEIFAEAKAMAEKYTLGPIYTPPTITTEDNIGTWVQPNTGGGTNWNGGAFDPEIGYLFVPSNNYPQAVGLRKGDPAVEEWRYFPSWSRMARPKGLPITKPPWLTITATDMSVGEHSWQRAIGSAPEILRKHPALAGLDLDFDSMGQIGINPSPLVTKSLLFLGQAGNRTGDRGTNKFDAYDKTTGEIYRQFELPSLVQGAPMSYRHEGKQYIVAAVSSPEHMGELVALALTEPNSEPQLNNFRKSAEIERIPISARERSAGQRLFDQHCATCHGPDGRGVAGSGADLRQITGIDYIGNVIRSGTMAMPSLKGLLTEEEIEQVSKFVAAGAFQ